MSVYLLATLDTKGVEAAYVRDRLQEQGVSVVTVDAGCLAAPPFKPDITSQQVYSAAGASLEELRKQADRGAAVSQAAKGTAKIVQAAFDRGEASGVLALGGSAGTTIGTTAMQSLPLGVPKVMVSTLASGQTRPYVGDKDIFMLNSVVDIAGLNRISRLILDQAARAMAGLIQVAAAPPEQPPEEDKPLVAATMFGVTTPCVQRAREVLQDAGYEVLVFHATGNGGQAMESLIEEGLIAGVLDITTTELADELVGGVLSAGPDRLTAAGRKGVPQVISVGALDMVNFGPLDSTPEKFQSRKLYQHNPTVTLMRTTSQENAELGKQIAVKAAVAKGSTAILLPLQGVSAIDKQGAAFDDPAARQALFEAVRQNAGDVEILEFDQHINDAAFAEAAANKLIEFLKKP